MSIFKNRVSITSVAKGRATSALRSAVEALESRTLLTAVVVNNITDTATGTGVVTLRDAISMANTSSTATTITFDATVFAKAQTVTLNGTQLELSNTKEPTTITGPAVGVTVSGNNKSRVLLIDSNVSVTMSGVCITHGNRVASGDAGGGGIANSGILKFTDATISNNTAAVGNAGVVNDTDGTLTLMDVTVSDNTTPGGDGGIGNGGGIVTLINVTVTGNTAASVHTAGIENFGGSMTMNNVTVSGNVASGGISGGGVSNENAGVLTISNSIIAGNSVTGAGTGPDVFGNFTSKGFNLIGKTDASTGWTTHDFTGTIAKPLNALLGALANNGGPTQTLLPLTGSPAIDKGSNALIPKGITTDQRGLGRIVDGTVDIGAVEVQPLITITAPAKQTATQGVSATVTLGSFTQFGGTTPYKVDVNWGDGSADTILTLSAAGTIPATAHAFAKAGTLTVSETITDGKSVKSKTATFTDTVAAAAKITLTAPANQTAIEGVSKSVTLGSFVATGTTAPYQATINWGDGSANTVVKLTAAGTIPATAHTFIKAGTLTITETITDAKGVKSNTATFTDVVTAALGSISGEVYNDSNGDGKLDAGDLGLGLWTVNLSLGGKVVKTATTNISGAFSFTGLAAGTYVVTVVQVSGAKATKPTGGTLTLTLTAGQNSTGSLFGEEAVA